MEKDLKTSRFIEKAKKVHEDKYDYTPTFYVKAQNTIKIKCKVHDSVFEQKASVHLRGSGCPQCHIDSSRADINKLISKAKTKFNNKYSYHRMIYTGKKNDIRVTCPVHGDFLIQASSHFDYLVGCPHCEKDRLQTELEDFLKCCNSVHDSKYTYEATGYRTDNSRIKVICPHHGEFFCTAKNHKKGSGCPKCKMYGEQTPEGWFIEEAKKVHGEKFNYSLVEIVDKRNPVTIVCPIHGLFEQAPEKHLKSKGCRQCTIKTARRTNEDFIKQASKTHSDFYDYSKTEYINAKKKVEITCPLHGVYFQNPYDHATGKGCSRCSRNLSKNENRIADYISNTNTELLRSDKKIIKPLELDIVIPDKKIAIEYNGLRWHSEKFGKDKHYHKNKTDLCKEQGYRLLHIWEDDFNNNPERELNFIKYSLGLYDNEKVYARKTTIKEIPSLLGREFLDKHHIQGSGSGSVYFGLYYQDNLVAVTSFLRKKDCVELTRHCADRQVIGGLGKITKYSSKYFQQDILSFCDLARFDGKSYLACGYEIDKVLPPDYKYVVGEERQHKFLWRKKHIKTKLPDVYNENLTEKEMMELADIPRIWDCGKLRLIYKFK